MVQSSTDLELGFCIVVENDPVREVGHILRLGHALGQRRLMDQELRAAIGDVPHTPLPEAVADSLRALGHKV